MNDNIEIFPKKAVKKTQTRPAFSGDNMAFESATATAVHVHVLAKYLASTGRKEHADVCLGMAQQIQAIASYLQKGN